VETLNKLITTDRHTRKEIIILNMEGGEIKMKTKMLSLVMIAFVVFSASPIAEAMTADKVIENMIASYERQMKDVEDITIVTDRDITYQKRATVKGRTIYKTRTETEIGIGIKSISIYDGVYHWWMDPVSRKVEKEKAEFNPYQILENLKTAQVKYAGTEKIDGHKTHILNVRDLNTMMGAEGMQKVSGKLWVDARDWVIRKMEMDMEIEDEKGEKRTAKVTVRMEDFRKVNGGLMPYRTVVTVSMPIELTPEEEQEMRKGLEEAQKALAEMSPEERAMMEKIMGPQIEMWVLRLTACLRFAMLTQMPLALRKHAPHY
jgi:outer membrane lipoprotein-sorting protein